MSNPTQPSAQVAGNAIGAGKLFVIAGPCVLESRELAFRIAEELIGLTADRDIDLIFKASYDKANRTSLGSGRGLGRQAGLEILADIRSALKVPICTDVHLPDDCAEVAEAADVLQIPAFLCRQTDLLIAAAETGRCVNIKKGQFLAPWDMRHAAAKVTGSGNSNVLLTERGSSFGYGRMVVDMTGFETLASSGHPVVFDATHSVQRPGGEDGTTGGDRRLAPVLARAALATGSVDGLFFEVHPDPDSSPSDGANMLFLEGFGEVLDQMSKVFQTVRAL